MLVVCFISFVTVGNVLQVYFLYQYSLQFFLDIFGAVLHNNRKLAGVKEYRARLSTITTDLFQVTTLTSSSSIHSCPIWSLSQDYCNVILLP